MADRQTDPNIRNGGSIGTPSLLSRMPWQIQAMFLVLSMIGIPGGMVAIREARDWRLEEKRIEVERERIKAQEKTNVLLERFERVLWRVERNLGVDPNGERRNP